MRNPNKDSTVGVAVVDSSSSRLAVRSLSASSLRGASCDAVTHGISQVRLDLDLLEMNLTSNVTGAKLTRTESSE